jgi:hypothetical protein
MLWMLCGRDVAVSVRKGNKTRVVAQAIQGCLEGQRGAAATAAEPQFLAFT